MATSPQHRFGQIIGELLELAVAPLLETFAKKHGLYLDKHGRRASRAGAKCSWVDLNQNSHDLDFVLERGGTDETVGLPAAFIETAWRRYTKHSRNKAQEIQGALMPLAETYRNIRPFTGVVLAGVFTDGALAQLRSLKFTVLYIPYDTVLRVMLRYGIDAAFDEATADADVQKNVDGYERLSLDRRRRMAAALLTANRQDVEAFLQALEAAVSRQIERIVVLPLHGKSHEFSTVAESIQLIERYVPAGVAPLDRFEIQILYSNGDRIEVSFREREAAIEFLRNFQPTLKS